MKKFVRAVVEALKRIGIIGFFVATAGRSYEWYLSVPADKFHELVVNLTISGLWLLVILSVGAAASWVVYGFVDELTKPDKK